MELRVALEAWLGRMPEFTLADPPAVTWAAGQFRGPRTLPLHIRWPLVTLVVAGGAPACISHASPPGGSVAHELSRPPEFRAAITKLGAPRAPVK